MRKSCEKFGPVCLSSPAPALDLPPGHFRSAHDGRPSEMNEASTRPRLPAAATISSSSSRRCLFPWPNLAATRPGTGSPNWPLVPSSGTATEVSNEFEFSSRAPSAISPAPNLAIRNLQSDRSVRPNRSSRPRDFRRTDFCLARILVARD